MKLFFWIYIFMGLLGAFQGNPIQMFKFVLAILFWPIALFLA